MALLLNKLRAFALHLFASITVVACVFAVLYLLWYPAEVYLSALLEGGRLILFVDMILGPLLTFVVYDQAKKELKRDLSIIVGIQLVALSYGVFALNSQKPVLQLLYYDGVVALRQGDLPDQYNLPETEGVSGVPTYYLDLPERDGAVEQLKTVYALTGEDIVLNMGLYQPIQSMPRRLKEIYLPDGKLHTLGSCYRLPFSFRGEHSEGCFPFLLSSELSSH